MNLSKEDIVILQKIQESNDRMEEFFEKNRTEWIERVDPLFKCIINFRKETFQNIIESQSTALSYREMINDQISMFLSKRSKETVKIKNLKEDKFVYFSTSFQIKATGGQMNLLIDSRLGENERTMELIESYIEFLRETVKSLDNFQWTIKNIISLMEYMGSK